MSLLQKLKAVLTRGNRPSYQERVIAEAKELDAKLVALTSFIANSPLYKKLPEAERRRLVRQSAAMFNYASILDERIRNFQ